MDVLKTLFSCLRVAPLSRPLALRPLALASSPFGKLPPELVVYIARYLPAPSVAAFYFCCRPICAILGSQCLEALQKEKSARYRFLALFERDLPDAVACFYCEKLHGIKAVRLSLFYYNHYNQIHTCRKVKVFASDFLYSSFDYTAFQMVMKRHRQGRDTTEFLNRRCHNTKTSRDRGYIMQTTVWPRIIGGAFLIRKQTIFILPRIRTQAPELVKFMICPHIRYVSPRTSNRTGHILRTIIAPWDTPPTGEDARGIFRCRFCLTEFRIDFKAYEGHKVALFFTRWQDLGEGRAPSDWKWISHVRHSNTSRRLADYGGRSICDVFEGSEGFIFDSILTPENRRVLRKEGCREKNEL